MKKNYWITFGLLLLLFVGSSFIKIDRAFRNPLISKTSDYAAFWTESAVHYRWAKMVALGEKIPQQDINIQYPEGLAPFKDETPLMDWAVGKLYRQLHLKIPFHHFVIYFYSFFSSLSLFPLFIIVYRFSQNRWIALICSAIFSIAIANISSIASGSIPREIFSLVFIFFHLAFLVLALAETKLKWSFLSGLFLFISLLAWHVSQFYYALLILFMIGYLWLVPSKTKTHLCFAIQIGFVLLAGILLPALVKGGFLLSYAAILSYSFLIGLYSLPAKWSIATKRMSILGLVGAFFILIPLLQTSHSAEFSHVYEFLKAKVLYLGQKPLLPEKLSYESKVMWMSSFETPSFKTVWNFFGVIPFLVVPNIIGFFQSWKRKTLTLDKILIFYFFTAFIFFYWLMVRMDCFLIFFAIAIMGILPTLPKHFNPQKALYLLLLLILGFSFNFYKLHNSNIRQVTPPIASVLDILREVESKTLKEDPIIPPFPLGPSIAAFTQRPVVLHSKFENHSIREKVKAVEEGLFKDEETFHSLCQKYGARYIIIDSGMMLDLSQESLRYRTNNLFMNKNMVLYKMHFDPLALQQFKLIYSNIDYRIYQILKEGDSKRVQVPVQPAIYDKRNFTDDEILLK